jgi:D-sedoheptulose 7-phosphate isomerase
MASLESDYLAIIRSVVLNDDNFPSFRITRLANDLVKCFERGNKIAFVGNGGSAAEAMHLAAEFTGKCVIDHRPLPALCLNESQSSLTAIGNDYGFDQIFVRQVQAHMKPGDLIFFLSTSGNSKNVQKGIAAALAIGCEVHLWTGAGYLNDREDINVWQVNSLDTPRIQEVHLIWGHVLSEIVEKSIV